MTQPPGVKVIEEVTLDQPALLVMLAGWVDAAGVASSAAQSLENTGRFRTIATFEPDLFIDFRARRPVMQLREGVSERLIWPEIELKAGTDDAGRDVLLLTGFEPDANWNFFSRAVADVCIAHGTRIMVGMGAYPFATPHTRPSRLSCTTPSAPLARSVRYLRNTLDVPAGIEAVLEHAFHGRGIPAIGLWVQVPHYISTSTYPAATAALLAGVAETAGLTFDISHLTSLAASQQSRLDELVENNPEHIAMIRQMEAAYDVAEETSAAIIDPSVVNRLHPSDIPSGDELAAEVEQFLREQDG